MNFATVCDKGGCAISSTGQNVFIAQLDAKPLELLQAAIAQTSIAIAVCDHDFTVRFFNAAIGKLIEPGHRDALGQSGALCGDLILRLLGVDEVAAVIESVKAEGSWHDVTAQQAVHVVIEQFGDDKHTGGWLITARAHVKLSPLRMTERELIARSAKLTLREREVMLALEEGASNKVIAARLGISPRTVEFHRAKMMQRFAARSVIDLVRKVTGDARSSQSLSIWDANPVANVL